MDKIKKEAKYLGILFVLLVVIFKIVFFKEGIFNIIKLFLGIFWVFIIPGFVLMYYWAEKLNFLERLLIGTAVSAAVISIASYYIGLVFGLHVKYHGFLLPIIFLIIDYFILRKKKTQTAAAPASELGPSPAP